MQIWVQRGLRATGATLITGILAALSPGCTVGYLARQGYFQAELLASRVPLEKAEKEGGLDDEQLRKLRLVAEIKIYGREIGLSSTHNYESIALGWKREIWNVSACDPVSFTSVTWGFPIVGRIPYLGYFRRTDADEQVSRLRGQGYDAWARTAGAYSTLGWFRDPVLPGMLSWRDVDLADTILHELAHATLWVPGSVAFNESYANFVGNEAGSRWLVARYGVDSPQVVEATRTDEDTDRWAALMRDIYADLDELYQDPTLSREEKLTRKQATFARLPTRVAALGLHDERRYLRAVRTGTWNNARMVQYRLYDTSRDKFAVLLERHGGDLGAFIAALAGIVEGADDPYAALDRAVTVP